MTPHERVAASHLMTARELVDFTRSEEAVADDNWMALSLALASKLEMNLNEQRYRRAIGWDSNSPFSHREADADLQAAVRDWQVP